MVTKEWRNKQTETIRYEGSVQYNFIVKEEEVCCTTVGSLHGRRRKAQKSTTDASVLSLLHVVLLCGEGLGAFKKGVAVF
jgi:hypothetical protein